LRDSQTEPAARLVAILFNDITERRRAELRRTALLAMGDRLRSLQTVPGITSEASKMVGETLDAIRVAFGRIDASGEHVIVESDWSADGYESLAGKQRLSDLGDLQSMRSDDRPVVVSDVLSAATSAASQEVLGGLGVRSFAAITIMDPDGSTSLFMVHAAQPRNWTAEDLVFIRNAGDRVASSVARREAEAFQQVLNLELSHRMKNTLTMVMAIAKQTFRSVADQAPVEVFNARIQALSSAHMALLEQRWMKANIADVVNGVLGTVDDIARFDTRGPSVDLDARSALSMSLLLHELSTNALKYGALSEPAGRVAISWEIFADQLILRWRESGGPEVAQPTRTGRFGRRRASLSSKGFRGGLQGISPSGGTALLIQTPSWLERTSFPAKRL
jgi:two-component sensor histidine kinase